MGCSGLRAQPSADSADSIRISLLTCDSGEEIYALFGHTCIRYEHPSQGIDLVFNYGMFDFNAPNFIYRFVKGETDYVLGVVDFARFEREYRYLNRAVWQQTLQLTAEEKGKLFRLLQVNSLPENRVYRYNFFFDNCATRPRDKIEECISGQVVYRPSDDNKQSFRDIVRRSSRGQAWSRFGMDFCLGAEADRPISYREEMFAPFYLRDAFAGAVIRDGGKERALVSRTTEIISPTAVEKADDFLLTPLCSAILLFIAVGAATIYGQRKRRSLWGIDLLLFAASGLAGCVITFLSCFSVHPAVSPNYLIAVFHPLHLLLLPFFLRKEAKGKKSYYHFINMAVLTFFVLSWPINPQQFDFAVLPLTFCLLIRSASHIERTRKKK
jgi:hypothetical protein